MLWIIKVFFNPALNRPDIYDFIAAEFGLTQNRMIVKKVVDGSTHYEYLVDFRSNRKDNRKTYKTYDIQASTPKVSKLLGCFKFTCGYDLYWI